KQDLKEWANTWVKKPGLPLIRSVRLGPKQTETLTVIPISRVDQTTIWKQKVRMNFGDVGGLTGSVWEGELNGSRPFDISGIAYVFPNYQDYGYGIFLLDDKSRDYVLKNIQNEKDDFLRTMMWGSLWDSVREGELAPKEYVELVVRHIGVESDESTIQTLLGRVSTAMTYYMSEPPAVAGDFTQQTRNASSSLNRKASNDKLQPPATAGGSDLRVRLENLLIDRMQKAPTLGQRITFYRAFLNIASTENARNVLKQMLRDADMSEPPASAGGPERAKESTLGTKRDMPIAAKNPPANAGGSDTKLPLKTKDKFDIVTKLLILRDPDALKLLADLEKSETSDEAKRYAYAAKAGIATSENKAKLWNDFTSNKTISESWIEAAFVPFNTVRHSELTLPYLEKALNELPNHKRNRKIFFVNGWLAAFISGQRDEKALAVVNKFLADNPNLDRDLRLKILENSDLLERAVKIRSKYGR
ncbi:MAG: ERAP1-like C-terminal domain-containing protein, partial [Pyrinomonadaceae bacterium]